MVRNVYSTALNIMSIAIDAGLLSGRTVSVEHVEDWGKTQLCIAHGDCKQPRSDG